jgi:hypothetical protein
MSIIKKKIRCGYCRGEGHNRNNCPSMKASAAEGDSYAINSLERAKLKRCSYCKEDGHTKATCEKAFNDQRNDGLARWAGLNAAANVVSKYKLASGAFIFGPVFRRWESYMNETPAPNYEMANYYITRVLVDGTTVRNENSPGFSYDTLTDFQNICSTKTNLPFFNEEICALDKKFDTGKEIWLSDNQYRGSDITRKRYNESFNVLVEASQEEVEKTVAEILKQKPDIVDFDDRKSYQSAMRAKNKK